MTPSSAKPRIGIVTWDFVGGKGGMGRSMVWMAETVSEEFDVVVGTPVSELQVGKLQVACLQMTSLLSVTKRFGGHILFSLLLPFVLQRWIRKHHIDFLLIPAGPGGVFLLKKPHIPYLCSVYHLYEQQARVVPGQGWKKIFVPLEKKTLRGAHALLTFNDDARSILKDRYRISADHIIALPHAVDDAWKSGGSVKKTRGLCICVARLEKRKGVELLLQAWPQVLAARPDARLMIVGQGILASTIDKMIRPLFGVVRIPSLLFSDLVAVTRQAEVALCPAYLEGFGLAAAEAMMCGTAVVAAKSEGLRCLFGDGLRVMGYGERDFLFEPGNIANCARAIVEALNNDTRRQEIVAGAQKKASTFFDRICASQALLSAINDTVTNELPGRTL